MFVTVCKSITFKVKQYSSCLLLLVARSKGNIKDTYTDIRGKRRGRGEWEDEGKGEGEGKGNGRGKGKGEGEGEGVGKGKRKGGGGEKKSDCTYTGAALSQGIITWK